VHRNGSKEREAEKGSAGRLGKQNISGDIRLRATGKEQTERAGIPQAGMTAASDTEKRKRTSTKSRRGYSSKEVGEMEKIPKQPIWEGEEPTHPRARLKAWCLA